MQRRILIRFTTFFLFSLGAHGQITLASPQQWQVFQRHSRLEGKMLIAGHADVAADVAEARIIGTSISGPLPGRWTRLPLKQKSGGFHFTGDVPAGGFYTVEIRLLRADELIATTTVEHVGVGEVFVISGQSNSTNWGEQRQTPQTGMVTTFSGTSWRLADDPQPGTQDNSERGSFIPPFGDELYRKYSVPIGVVCVGRGATSIRQWLLAGERVDVLPTTSKFIIHDPKNTLISDGTLFNVMTQRIRQLGKNGFRALLWDQGQSDSSLPPEHRISGERFREMTTLLIRASRKHAGWNIPWMTAVGTYMSPELSSDPAIQTAQRSLWKSGMALEGPDTDLLTGAYREKDGRGVHYNDRGLKTVGAAWATKVESYIDSQLKKQR